MSRKLSKQEATRLAKDHQSLAGKIIINEKRVPEIIIAVCIAPSEKKARLTFMERFKLFKNADKAIGFYDGYHFDVIVIFKTANEYQYKELSKFFEHSGAIK